MAIAAVPNYLQRADFSTASPGLRFGQYLKLWGEDRRHETFLWKREENKGQALRVAALLTPDDRARGAALVQRQDGLRGAIAPDCVLHMKVKAVSPFVTGLGNEHPLENGFAFLSPYGLPYLPGSGIKGVIRQAARELAEGKWGERRDWSEAPEYAVPVNGETVLLSMIDVLFGREPESGDSQHVRGVLSFWDVIPQVTGTGSSLHVEVMTPHQTHYYQKGETPHDSGQPNPICFLTVPPESRFAFTVVCDSHALRRLAQPLSEGNKWQHLLRAAFEHAFEWLGFGAKTAVGYGAMADEMPTEDHQQVSRGDNRVRTARRAELRTWERASLKFRAQSGALIAVESRLSNKEACATHPKGEEILTGLPQDVQKKIRENQFVQGTVDVIGSEIVAVRMPS